MFDKSDQDTIWVEDRKLSRSPGCISQRRIGRKQSFGLILPVERLNTGHLDVARGIFGKGPIRAEPHVEFHAVSFDNGILSLLVQNLEAQLSIKAGCLADIGRGEYRNRAGESRLALR